MTTLHAAGPANAGSGPMSVRATTQRAALRPNRRLCAWTPPPGSDDAFPDSVDLFVWLTRADSRSLRGRAGFDGPRRRRLIYAASRFA